MDCPSHRLDHPHHPIQLHDSPSPSQSTLPRPPLPSIPHQPHHPRDRSPLFSTSPPPPSSTRPLSPERLPTYAELNQQEGHRFGRWKGWIEKRARERTQQRSVDRHQAHLDGRPFGTAWDLPDSQSTLPSRPSLDSSNCPTRPTRNSSIISAADEHAAFASASQNHKHAYLLHSQPNRRPSNRTQTPRPSLEPGPGAVNLTPSASIHQIGSRFLPQFSSQPLCAIRLPLDRFLLVGTIDGLYVCDLIPSLSGTIKTDLISSTDSKIYQLWTGLGIHQLDIAIEDAPRTSSPSKSTANSNSSGMAGIVIALTSPTEESSSNGSMDGLPKSIKMWPLQSLINLVKFRAFSENSECLDLRERWSSSKRSSVLAAGTSALVGLKSMFEKGKQRAEGMGTSSSDHSNHPTTPSSANFSHLELPLQWSKQTIALDSPRIQANGPILFIKLSNSPVQGFNPLNDKLDQETGMPIGLRPRSRTFSPERYDQSAQPVSRSCGGWWYIIIATKQMIFVMESPPSPHRTWNMCAEMSAPFTPKTADLVLSDFCKPISNRVTMISAGPNSRLQSPRRQYSSPAGLGELSVLLTMKEYAVTISLSDLSVREIDLQGAITASQSTVAGSSVGSTKKLGGGSFSSLINLESVHSTLMNLPLNGAGLSVEPILSNKWAKDGFGKSRDDGFRVESRRHTRSLNDRRWIGCEELLVPVRQPRQADSKGSLASPRSRREKRKPQLRSIYLITRGHLTYAVLCPFGYDVRAKTISKQRAKQGFEHRPGSATGGIPPPIILKPFHTFTWRAIPVKVQAHIVPTPAQWGGADGGSKADDGKMPSDEVFCCLTAFTASGIEVQEGFISLSFMRAMWDKGKSGTSRLGMVGAFFTPASQRAKGAGKASVGDDGRGDKVGASEEARGLGRPAAPISTLQVPAKQGSEADPDSDELTDSSSYDYSARIGFLCNGGPWFATNADRAQEGATRSEHDEEAYSSSTCCSDSDEDDDDGSGYRMSNRSGRLVQGSFFWKEAVGEWKIMYVCSN